MRKTKRLGRFLSRLLLAAIAVVVVVSPVSAISCFVTPLSTTVNQSNAQAGEPTKNSQVMVSVIRRYGIAGSAVVGRMEDGTEITVLGTKNQFYKIDCYDMTAFIAKSQVRQDEDGKFFVDCKEGSSETTYMKLYNLQDALTTKSGLRKEAEKYIGIPYVWGGQTPKGFDCSGYTQYVFRKLGISIHRTVINQMGDGLVIPKEDLQCGDLVLFSNTTSRGFASHVGMYIGNGKIIHSGNGGVAISKLDTPYWNKYYQCSRRIIPTGLTTSAAQPTVGLTQNNITGFWRKSDKTNGESISG